MRVKHKRIILTGATGGIGRELALKLAQQGASLALVDLNHDQISSLAVSLSAYSRDILVLAVDLSTPGAAVHVVETVVDRWGHVDMIINNAGILDFTLFEAQPLERVEQMIKINTLAPIQLVRLLMPYFRKQDSGHIVNIGSIFGSLAFPHYVVYSASKYAMRGFSQALARELIDTNIRVTYVGPRAVQTPLNDATSLQMMAAGKMRLDTPAYVAGRIISAIEQDKREVYIGLPEKLFAWLNGFIPRLISFGIKEQTRQARIFASRHD